MEKQTKTHKENTWIEKRDYLIVCCGCGTNYHTTKQDFVNQLKNKTTQIQGNPHSAVKTSCENCYGKI